MQTVCFESSLKATMETRINHADVQADMGFCHVCDQGCFFVVFFSHDMTHVLLRLGFWVKKFSRRHTEIFFLFFPRKQDLSFHANCLHWRQFA